MLLVCYSNIIPTIVCRLILVACDHRIVSIYCLIRLDTTVDEVVDNDAVDKVLRHGFVL